MRTAMTSRWSIVALAVLGAAAVIVDPHIAGLAFAGAILVFAAGFVVVYRRSAWRQTAPGRAVMGLLAVTVGVAAWMLWINVTGVYPGSELLRAGLYLAAALMLANLLRVLVRGGDDR